MRTSCEQEGALAVAPGSQPVVLALVGRRRQVSPSMASSSSFEVHAAQSSGGVVTGPRMAGAKARAASTRAVVRTGAGRSCDRGD